MTERKIVMQGPFTDSEIAELIAFVRTVDNKPGRDGRFRVLVSAPDASVDEAFAALRAGLPESDDRKTDFWVLPK